MHGDRVGFRKISPADAGLVRDDKKQKPIVLEFRKSFDGAWHEYDRVRDRENSRRL